MLYRLHRIVLMIVGAMTFLSTESPAAQGKATAQYVPGELLVGCRSQKYCESLARQLGRSQQRQRLRVGGEKIRGLSIEKSGNSGLMLKIEFSDNIKGQLRSNPGVELRLLKRFARQIQLRHQGIAYAHPNWVVSVNPLMTPDVQRMPSN